MSTNFTFWSGFMFVCTLKLGIGLDLGTGNEGKLLAGEGLVLQGVMRKNNYSSVANITNGFLNGSTVFGNTYVQTSLDQAAVPQQHVTQRHFLKTSRAKVLAKA